MADKGKGKGKAPAAAPAPTPAPAPASHSKAPQTAKQPKAEKSNAKRVARPDDEKYEKDQAALDAKIKELQERQAALRERISGADGTSAGGSRRKELQEEKSKYLASSRILKDEREKILRQFEDVRKVREAKLKDLDDLRARAGPHKTQEKIDQVIKEMEVKIESGSLKLIEEKKLVTEIGNLKKSKKTLEVYDKQAQDLEADKKNYEALKEKLDAKSEEQRKNFEKVKEIEAKLDALKKEQEDDKAKLNQLIEDRNTTSQHIRELFDKKRELFESMRKQRDEYRVFQQEEIIKRKEAQRLEREQFAEERRKALEEKRREERMTPKFVDEITSASNLIFFLQSTYKNEEKAQATEEEKKAAVEIKGMVALKSKSDRLDDDVFYSAKGKAQKEKRPAQKVLKKTDSIKLPLVAIEQFAQLSVPIPSTVNDVDQTLQLLEEKKKHFEQRQKEELEKAKAEEEAEKAAEKEAALKAEQEATKPKEEAKQEPAEEAKEEEVAEEAKEEVAEEAKDDEAKANEEAS